MTAPLLVRLLSRISSALRKTPLARSKTLLRIQAALLARAPNQNPVHLEDFSIHVHDGCEFIARKLMLFKGYEQFEIDHLCSLLQPGDTAADIGANNGLYTLHFSRAVGPEGHVLAFEPDPANIELLEQNVETNGCHNVSIHPYALGDKKESRRLYLCDDNKGYQSLADLAGTGRHIDIQLEHAGTALEGHRPRVMKIDVEGAEPLVWRALRHKPPHVFLEFVPAQIRALGNDPLAFLEALEQENYRLRYFTDDTFAPTTPKELTDLALKTGKDYNVMADHIA